MTVRKLMEIHIFRNYRWVAQLWLNRNVLLINICQFNWANEQSQEPLDLRHTILTHKRGKPDYLTNHSTLHKQFRHFRLTFDR